MYARHAFGLPFFAVLSALLVTACSSSAHWTPQVDPSSTTMRTTGVFLRAHPVCGSVVIGQARCHAWQFDGLAPDLRGRSIALLPGYHPSDLQSAYLLPSAGRGARQTVAVVDANDDPRAEADMAVYRAAFNLVPCTTANGCFRKVNQSGVRGHYPAADGGWAYEIALDLEMVSAVCPSCRILLVEANSASVFDLASSVDTAVRLGATVVSNSYGGGEFSDELSMASHYLHPGVMITASSGDSGYGAQVPAAFSSVTAVGGTSLVRDRNSRGWAETAWSGAGAGCSAYIDKPSWQSDTACPMRTVADVAAVADPSTGVTAYDSYAGAGGWLVLGGTSVGSPIVAAVYALAGNAASLPLGSHLYGHRQSLFDVVGGSDGSCAAAYLCNAVTGYDGPTGLGTPNGIGAF